MNVITKEIIPGTHTHIYKMEKFPFSSPRVFLGTEKLIEELEKELKEMKDTLDAHTREMQKLNGYERIYTIITQLLGLMSSVPTFMALIEEELERPKKKGQHKKEEDDIVRR